VSYIYFTRIIIFLLASTLPFRLSWVSTAATQAATVVFYSFVGWNWRPLKTNPYLKVSTEDDDAAREQAIRMEEMEMELEEGGGH